MRYFDLIIVTMSGVALYGCSGPVADDVKTEDTSVKEAMPPANPVDREAKGLPDDVLQYKKRRELCEHFSGEPPYDAKRAADIRLAVEENCTGADAELAELRGRYGGDRKIMLELDDNQNKVAP